MERTPPKKVAAKIIRILKKERPDYHYVKKVLEHVRLALNLKGTAPAPRKLPELLTDKEMSRFYETVWGAANRTHTVMIKLLLFTGIRNSELAELEIRDVDLDACTVRIDQGKGKKDRYVPFPKAFRGELSQYIESQQARKARYLFETNRLDKYTTRWIRKIIKGYADRAKIKKRIYPHLFRHQLLTHLAKKGIIDAKLQLISGHGARKSLEIYQDLSLADVADAYQEAMKDFPVQ
jgi:integrase/recombinase XerD